MRDARKFKDEEALDHPIDQICAIVQSQHSLDTIIHTLGENGFKADAIGLLQGKKDAQKLDQATGKQGLLAKVAKMWPEFGDSAYLEQYRKALIQDKAVVGIAVQDENEASKVRQILKSGGARFLVYFGEFVVEVLEP